MVRTYEMAGLAMANHMGLVMYVFTVKLRGISLGDHV